jgi:hypothetical protein
MVYIRYITNRRVVSEDSISKYPGWKNLRGKGENFLLSGWLQLN